MYFPVGMTEEEERIALTKLREREVLVSEKSLFWDRFQTIAIGLIPLLTFFGIRWSKR